MQIRPNIAPGYVISRDDDGAGFAIRTGETLVLPAASEALRGVTITVKRVGGAGAAPVIQGTVDGAVDPTLPTLLMSRTIVCAGPAGWFTISGHL